MMTTIDDLHLRSYMKNWFLGVISVNLLVLLGFIWITNGQLNFVSPIIFTKRPHGTSETLANGNPVNTAIGKKVLDTKEEMADNKKGVAGSKGEIALNLKEIAVLNSPVDKQNPEESKRINLEMKNLFSDYKSDSYQDRLKNIQEYCEKYRKNQTMWKQVSMANNHPLSFWPFVSHGYRVMWAEVPKIASSTLKIHFSKLKGTRKDERDTRVDKIVDSTNITNIWNYNVEKEGFTSFAFVRHPFTRVLSAYRSKLENERSDGYEAYMDWNIKMARKYRPESMKNVIKKETATFSEFVDSIPDKFLDDRHWRPISRLIYPCELHYTFIGKIETMEKDLPYLFTEIGASFLNTNVWDKKRDSNGIIEQYFSTISKRSLLRLYEYYKMDFELFGYDLTEIFAYAKS